MSSYKAFQGTHLSFRSFPFKDESEKLWLAALIEESVHWPVETERQVHLAKLLLRSQVYKVIAVQYCKQTCAFVEFALSRLVPFNHM